MRNRSYTFGIQNQTVSPLVDTSGHYDHTNDLTTLSPFHQKQLQHVQEGYEDYFDPNFPRFLSVILLFIGLFGNLLSIWVFSKTSMRKNSTFIYLLFLCIVDLFVLLFGLGDIVLYSYFGFIVREKSLFVCRTHTFLTYMFTHLSSFILASVSIDRAIATNLIRFAKDYCKPHTAYKVLLFNLFLASLPNSHYLIFLGHYEERNGGAYNDTFYRNSSNLISSLSSEKKLSCTSLPSTVYDRFLDPYYNWMDLIFYAILPFLIMAVCSFFIIRVILDSNKRMKSSLSHRTSTAILNASIINRVPENLRRISINDENEIDEETPMSAQKKKTIRESARRMSSAMIKRLVNSSENNPANSRMNKTLHLTYTLISINTLFFCLVSPLVIMTCVVKKKEEIQNSKILYNVVYLLAYSNHSFNFVFYGLSSPPFREAIQNFFKKKKDSSSTLTILSLRRNTNNLLNKGPEPIRK